MESEIGCFRTMILPVKIIKFECRNVENINDKLVRVRVIHKRTKGWELSSHEWDSQREYLLFPFSFLNNKKQQKQHIKQNQTKPLIWCFALTPYYSAPLFINFFF